MNPWTLLGLAKISNNGGELELTQRDKEFSIHLKGVRGELMNSRMHSSELALSDLGCAHVKNTENTKVLDVDNGPEGFTHGDNNNLYSLENLSAIRQSLKPKGMLAVWSAWHDPKFTTQLKKLSSRLKQKL